MFSAKNHNFRTLISVLLMFMVLSTNFPMISFAADDDATNGIVVNSESSDSSLMGSTTADQIDKIGDDEIITASTTEDTASFAAFSSSSFGSGCFSSDCSCDQNFVHTCAIPDSLGDSTTETVTMGWDGVSLQDVFNNLLIDRSVMVDQKQYQSWNIAPNNVATVKVDFLNKISGLNHVFGYYKNGDISTFTPIFKSGAVDGFASTTEFSIGQSVTLDISGATNIGFAIKTNAGTTFATLNLLNENGNDHAVAYDWNNNVYIISFEDLPLASSDTDYNDMTVKISVLECKEIPPPTNTPPTIVLTGANPLGMTINTLFVDPGATATDTEDGNLTSQIVRTGIVNASTTGTYILTYTVTDSGGLSASTTRMVIVSDQTIPPVNPPVNPPSGGGGGIGGHRHFIATTTGEILGATSCMYLRDYLKIDWQNDKIEILKLQSFLNVFEKENLSYTGVFDQATFEAVQRFQTKYANDILHPWGDKVTTGFVYILTKKKINEIYCNTLYPLTQDQQNEIDAFKNSEGVSGNVGRSTGADIQNVPLGEVIGSGNVNPENISSQVVNIPVVNLSPATTSTSTGESAIRNIAVSLFALSSKMFDGWFNSCGCTLNPWLLILILLALVIIITKLFLGWNKSKNINKINAEENKEPIIILPGVSEKKENNAVLPDEEIVIENPEEETEDTTVTTPDLR